MLHDIIVVKCLQCVICRNRALEIKVCIIWEPLLKGCTVCDVAIGYKLYRLKCICTLKRTLNLLHSNPQKYFCSCVMYNRFCDSMQGNCVLHLQTVNLYLEVCITNRKSGLWPDEKYLRVCGRKCGIPYHYPIGRLCWCCYFVMWPIGTDYSAKSIHHSVSKDLLHYSNTEQNWTMWIIFFFKN